MAFLDRSNNNNTITSPSPTDITKRQASVTFSDASTIINDDEVEVEVVTPPARVFPNNEIGNRVILPNPFNSSSSEVDEDEEEDPEACKSSNRKSSRAASHISDFRTHGIKAPSVGSFSKKRSSSGSIKPLKFSSADGRAYGTVGQGKRRRRRSSVRSMAERHLGARCSICRLERKNQEAAAGAGSRAGVVMFLVVMNVVFLTATVFCIVWPVMRRQWDKTGCVVVPVALWMAFVLVTASSWRVVKTCECPPRRASDRGKGKRRSSGPLFPRPAVWLDRTQ